MARNAGKGYRIGAVRLRSQVKNPRTRRWTLRGDGGLFANVKADRRRFKGVRRER